MNSIPEVDQYNTLGLPESIAITEKLLQDWLLEQQASPRLHYVFGIIDTTSGIFIGMIGLRLGKLKYRIAEVWYKLFPDHWGKGYATEALKELLRFAFKDMNLHRIEAGCAIGNTGSIKVLEKAGMIREGHKRKILPIRGEWIDNYEYAILEEDFTG
jgi:ribosomal-protein-alanine N-acetyltransferase